MKHRVEKKRALQKAGFVHVAGWVRKDQAEVILDQIEDAKPEVDLVLKASERQD